MNAACRRIAVFSLLIATASLPAADAGAQGDGHWWDGFGPAGVEGGIYSMTGHYEDLIVGGLFDEAGGVAAANIAQFNGRHWLDVDGGTDGRVRAVFSTVTTLIIGGTFWYAGGTPCDHVADLELGEWTPMGDGLPDLPNAFVMHNAALHAGGRLDSDGDLNYSMVARYDGINWHDLTGIHPDTNACIKAYSGFSSPLRATIAAELRHSSGWILRYPYVRVAVDVDSRGVDVGRVRVYRRSSVGGMYKVLDLAPSDLESGEVEWFDTRVSADITFEYQVRCYGPDGRFLGRSDWAAPACASRQAACGAIHRDMPRTRSVTATTTLILLPMTT